jgi:hypothetical protein
LSIDDISLDNVPYTRIIRDLHSKEKFKCSDCEKKIKGNMYYKSLDEKFAFHLVCFYKTYKTEKTTRFEILKRRSKRRSEQKKHQKDEILKKNFKKFIWEGDIIYTIDLNDEVWLHI